MAVSPEQKGRGTAGADKSVPAQAAVPATNWATGRFILSLRGTVSAGGGCAAPFFSQSPSLERFAR